MRGAIIGDIIGSRFEKQFPSGRESLFGPECRFTDDTILTCAIAAAKLGGYPYSKALKDWGRKYKGQGFSRRFTEWVKATPAQRRADPSMGAADTNGAVMRISALPWLVPQSTAGFNALYKEVEQATIPTHHNPDAVHAATTLAGAIHILLTSGGNQRKAQEYLGSQGYLPRASVRAYQLARRFDMSATGTLTKAIAAWNEAHSFEEAIRNALIIGGDTDTTAAIAGSLAEVTWGIPPTLWTQAYRLLPPEMANLLQQFDLKRKA